MVRLSSGLNGGLNMDTLDLSRLLNAEVYDASSTLVHATDGRHSLTVYGSGLTVQTDPAYVAGTVTRVEIRYDPDQIEMTLSGLQVPLVQLLLWLDANDPVAVFTSLMSGSDDLLGSLGSDLLRGYDGNDLIRGFTGADTLHGGLGNDTISGNTDFISGGNIDLASYLRGDEGNDSIAGAQAFDDINGNQGDDTCLGGGGSDWVVGGKGNDLLYGDLPNPADMWTLNPGDDIVYGNLGDDTCIGDVGADLIRGGQGNDSLSGGSGADWLSGDRGDDTVSGGVGADIFHTFGDAGLDRVLDFKLAEGDRIQLDPGTVYTVSQVGADTVIDMSGGGQMVLVGVTLSTLTPGWIFGA